MFVINDIELLERLSKYRILSYLAELLNQMTIKLKNP